MTSITMTMISDTLAPYGAHLNDDGYICRGEKTTIRVIVKRGRIAFMANGRLLETGYIQPSTIENFVESFWFWKKES